jgi:hypothetical protein
MFLRFENLVFRYEPFPIGLAKPVMDEATNRAFIEGYPPLELFKYIPKVGRKYSLSERFHARAYRSYIRSNPLWREFHRWIKSDAFLADVLSALRDHHIDLGYDGARTSPGGLQAYIGKLAQSLGHGRRAATARQLTARFEFSMLPADGGFVMPHTDGPAKVVTLIVSILDAAEWDPAFGGGTELHRPRDAHLAFNRLNRQARFEDMDVLDTFAFTPNQAVVFIKTFNSWHSVRPMTGVGSAAMRKTLTINIEAR